jgi:hypothetical protein
MILSFRYSYASLMIVLALAITTTACGGSYPTHSTPGGGQANSLTGLTLQAQSAPSIPANGTVKFIAYGTYGDPLSGGAPKDLTSTATWTSSDEGVATVVTGVVTGTGAGSVAITAKLGSYSDVKTVVVGLTPTIAVTPESTTPFNLSNPQRQFFANATYSDGTAMDLTNWVKWSASPTSVMKFDDPYGLQPGLATFTSTGTATVIATLRAGEEGNLTVTVDP